MTRGFLPTVAQWPATGSQERLGWIGASRGPRHQLIQPGDRLDVRIWDSSDNSLLTSPEQKDIALPDMQVAANGAIREKLQALCDDKGVAFIAPPLALCTDNAAMIAYAGAERFARGHRDGMALAAGPRWPLDKASPAMLGSGKKGSKA